MMFVSAPLRTTTPSIRSGITLGRLLKNIPPGAPSIAGQCSVTQRNRIPLRAAYRDFYRAEPFVRVVDKADIKYVKYSNYCDISVQFDERTGTVILISAIDNMVKGAAGQAIQNMNLIFGLEETCGLEMVPPAF